MVTGTFIAAWLLPVLVAPFVVFGGAAPGLLAALGLALAGRRMTSKTPIPFGPSIALALASHRLLACVAARRGHGGFNGDVRGL
jgi:hypothetical protein